MMEFLKKLAVQAGTVARAEQGTLSGGSIHHKSPLDLVTDADRKVEAFITGELAEHFPEYGIFGEEHGKKHADREYCFVIDPIDGTASFIHGLPNWCVSIGLMRNGRSVAGVVYQPVTGDLYYAAEGQGSFVNGIRLQVSERTELSDCILSTGFFCLRAQWKEENNLRFFNRIAPVLGDIRKYGSAALDLCMTARGVIDGNWELRLEPYDVAAGVIIAREAGATVTDLMGGDSFPTKGILATNGRIHEDILAYFHDFKALNR
ncbi:MAG: inositol monophosphatase [Lentisphaeria bacterium]|nr:inositol monophosphatase [Lentisphaeria bacterium]